MAKQKKQEPGDDMPNQYVAALVAYLQNAWQKFDAVNGWDLIAIYKVIADAVQGAEDLGRTYPELTGEQKLETVADAVNKLVDIPLVPEWLEKMGFRAVVKLLADFLVSALNRKYGHDWLAKQRPTGQPIEPFLFPSGDAGPNTV